MLEAEERALLQLEGISNTLDSRPPRRSAQELSFTIRTFFQEGLGLRYEFTAEELARELEASKFSQVAREASSKLYKVVEEMEYAGFRANRDEIKKALNVSRTIIIRLAKEAQDLHISADTGSKEVFSSLGKRIKSLSEAGITFVKNGNIKAARNAYSEILDEYPKLLPEEKEILKPQIINLHSMLAGDDKAIEKRRGPAIAAGVSIVLLILIFSALLVANQRGLLGRKLTITGFEFVCTGDICFSPSPSDMTFNQSENVTVYVCVTNPNDENITFATIEGNPLFSSIEKINNTCGSIRFTPSNSDVGSHIVTISVKNQNGAVLDLKQPTYTILNINDPPSIIGWFPENDTPTLPENYTLGFAFNYSASDPDIPYGDYLTSEWYLDLEPYAYNQSSINYSTGFCDAGIHNITVIVRDSYNLTDSHSWSVNVTNINRPPVLNGTIPDQAFNEDNSSSQFNLGSIFYDPDELECLERNKDNLSFSTELSDGGKAHILISYDYEKNAFLSATPEWCGNETIRIVANDSESVVYSNNFTVFVNCTPDAPVLRSIGAQFLRAGSPFLLYINATDPDTPYGDALSFSINDTSLFNITTLSPDGLAVINFTPSNEQVGTYLIRVTVTDSEMSSDSEDVLFNISYNRAPLIDSIPDQVVNETEQFIWQVNASDPDNDSINFSVQSDNYFPSLSIDREGKMIFTLSQGDVGNHTVTVSVTDEWGASANTTFRFEVLNINQPPTLQNLSRKRAKINKAFSMILNAYDPDLECCDSLSFGINDTSLFSLNSYNSSAVLINFTPVEAQIGNYSFLITVNDSWGGSDSKVLNLTVDYNFIPEILISNLNLTEGENFYFDLSEHTLDLDEDELSFNYTAPADFPNFYISPSGIIYFTANKSDVGNHTVNISVYDGENWSTSQILFTVFPVNNPPVLQPIGNLTVYENTTFTLQLNATDTENDQLEFTYLRLDSFPSFNLSSSGLINFTPATSEIGSHLVNISVRQVYNHSLNDWEIITVTVKPMNSPPQIVEYSPASTNLTMYETESQTFTQHTIDADFDNLTYEWILDSVIKSTAENFTYTPGYFGAGNHSLTFTASDEKNSTSITWNINVLNVNRPPYFGVLYDENFENNTEYENLSFTHSVELATDNSSQHYTSGILISRVLDFGEDNTNYPHFAITKAGYSGTAPEGTGVEISLRTSGDGNSWGNWTACTPLCENISSQRYVQYMLRLYTSEKSRTPVVDSVSIDYVISNITLPENLNLWWIYLGNFFKDEDLENLTYKYEIVSGEGFLNLTMSVNGRVQLIPLAEGNAVINFSASDPYGATSRSNLVNVTITRISKPVPVPQSSGGGSTTIIKEEVPKEVPYSLNIIVPQPVTIYRNDTLALPVKIVNSGNITLKGIELEAISENKNITTSIYPQSIDKLEPGEEVSANVILTSYQMFGSYEVLISARISDPKFNETNKVFVNALEKGSYDRKSMDVRIAYARDLLSQNSVCLELNEFISQAESDVEAGEYEKAAKILNSVVENCQYLISQKERLYQKPSIISIQLSRDKLIIIGSILLILILSVSVIIYTRTRFRG